MNEHIQFCLDNNPAHEGEGTIKALNDNGIEVELTKPCKEFNTGDVIIIDRKEIVRIIPAHIQHGYDLAYYRTLFCPENELKEALAALAIWRHKFFE